MACSNWPGGNHSQKPPPYQIFSGLQGGGDPAYAAAAAASENMQRAPGLHPKNFLECLERRRGIIRSFIIRDWAERLDGKGLWLCVNCALATLTLTGKRSQLMFDVARAPCLHRDSPQSWQINTAAQDEGNDKSQEVTTVFSGSKDVFVKLR